MNHSYDVARNTTMIRKHLDVLLLSVKLHVLYNNNFHVFSFSCFSLLHSPLFVPLLISFALPFINFASSAFPCSSFLLFSPPLNCLICLSPSLTLPSFVFLCYHLLFFSPSLSSFVFCSAYSCYILCSRLLFFYFPFLSFVFL